jgi:uncharacterized membrane protein YqjE
MQEPLEAGDPGAEMAADEATPHRPGPYRAMLGALLDALKTRLDLASVEVEIYLAYLAQSLLWGFATVVCITLGLFFATITVIAALWQTHRFAGLLGAMGLFLVLALVCGIIGARSLRSRPPLLAGTLEQLGRDQRRVSGSEGGE